MVKPWQGRAGLAYFCCCFWVIYVFLVEPLFLLQFLCVSV